LAIGHFAQRAAVLARDADRVSPLFRETRRIENQHARTLRQARPQLAPDAYGTPGRVRDEVLERLIRAWIVHTFEHRAHRLPATVAQQSEQVAPKRPALQRG
jgi:hypothetical protein